MKEGDRIRHPQRTLDASLWASVALLALANVMANRVLPSAWHLPWNLTVAAALVVIARVPGARNWDEIGLARPQLITGLRWGAVGAVVVVVAVVSLKVAPGTGAWFDDDLGRMESGELLLRLLVTIPLGTVLMEELAFRGCLPALLTARPGWSWWRGAAVSSTLFGLWHVLPSWDIGQRNETLGSAVGGPLGGWAPITATVLATTAAGLVFMWLRRRSDSVVAPMIVHYALNAAGTVAAWLTTR